MAVFSGHFTLTIFIMAPRENGLIRVPVTHEIVGSSPTGVARVASYSLGVGFAVLPLKKSQCLELGMRGLDFL